MSILVTGGLGFIGSHTVVELLNQGKEVVIADDLSNASITVLDKIETITGIKPPFYEIDVTVLNDLETIFMEHKISGIIHFAGYKAVGESVQFPLKYYYNNLVSTIKLAELAIKYQVPHIVFSSSATVYGDQKSPLYETLDLKETTNPYGETKRVCERILIDTAKANKTLSVTLLRYFNPIGAHQSGLIGEVPNGIPNNLMPYITQVAKGVREKLFVFGNDYDTVDGTGVRDYIHVVDLAVGHLKALDKKHTGVAIYNLGTGKGTSVLELVEAFQKENKIKINYEITARRSGDIATSYADAKKASKELGWEAKYSIADMVRDSWRFEKNYKS